MARYVDEPVIVRVTDADPTTFLWRDRIYVVREVLACWQERRAWWTAPEARAVHGIASEPVAVPDGELRVMAPGARVAIDTEREVWRVEAGCGRTSGWGTYDLCRETPLAGGTDTWRLLRVAD